MREPERAPVARHALGSVARVLVAALLPCVPAAARAQTASLTGTVNVFGDSLQRLAGVELSLEPSGRTTRSDASGAFAFHGVAPAEYRLRARHVGFDSVSMRVVVAGETAVHVALRRPSAQTLGTVTIAGRRVTYPARFADAYLRASRAHGTFWTREMIDSLFPLDVHSLLMRVPGARENGRTVYFARCAPQDGHVHVWVDGVRKTNYSVSGGGPSGISVRGGGSGGAPVGNVGPVEALRDVIPSSIQIMEVYSGVARIPGEFLDDACAVIVIWTKSY